jgi:HSP20 family protein
MVYVLFPDLLTGGAGCLIYIKHQFKEDVMDFTKLNPWNWFRKEDEQQTALPVQRGREEPQQRHPFSTMQAEMDRLLEQTLKRFGQGAAQMPSLLGGSVAKPRVDVAGSEKEYVITAELPGMDQDDIQIELKGDSLILRGEKKQEQESEEKGYYRMERRYGAFQRVLSLPDDADADQIKARYLNGVVRITLPRKEVQSGQTKRIPLE